MPQRTHATIRRGARADERPGQCGRSPVGLAYALLSGGLMAKMAIFLGGFLALTLLIGVLATISPV
ncbi:hypothetical protein [Pseudomonas citrulli]|uniref:Uncharacterized protein n=1 Tax=Pseudomonas citrulli TaxID=3064347 RepID=A0ABT9BTZ1_9PSED|nr:hypothetical protein [Pseudomonas sp. K18]MDO7896025.1 hypothetical protein [Pseudomonas sp. K18]